MTVQWKNTSKTYGFVSQAFHWIVAILIIATFVIGQAWEDTSRGDPNFELLASLHKSFGILILFLFIFRIIWRCINPAPALPENTPFFLRLIAMIIHWGLYALMFMLPFSGIGASFNAGVAIDFFGLFIIESPIPRNIEVAKKLIDVHHILTKTLLAFFLLHVLASLKHHFWNRDDILTRMLDIRRPFHRFLR
jgi:cytochrome b561